MNQPKAGPRASPGAQDIRLGIVAGFVAAAIALLPVGATAGPDAVLSVAAEETHKDPADEARLFIATTCATIEREAKRRALPPAYFARLIWKESRFNPNAVSPKGASGIAQFMPATARERRLADPFDPPTALAASAAFLQELKYEFGNLGLAAAAYNAGPNRVARWRDGGSFLPWETRDFVLSITGLTAEQWARHDVAPPDFALHETLPFGQACVRFASLAKPMLRRGVAVTENLKPWGVLIASQFSEVTARSALDRLARTNALIAEHKPIDIARRPNRARGGRLMYEVMLGVDDRASGNALCRRLAGSGGACIVVRN